MRRVTYPVSEGAPGAMAIADLSIGRVANVRAICLRIPTRLLRAPRARAHREAPVQTRMPRSGGRQSFADFASNPPRGDTSASMPTRRTNRPLPTRVRPARDRARLAIASVIWLVLAGAAGAAARANENEASMTAPMEPEGGRASVTTVVSGVIGYTRWPTPMSGIRVCAVGAGPGVDELAGRADSAASKVNMRVHVVSDSGDASNQCDVIYVGRLAGNAARELLQRTVGRPVLTIGEGTDFCTDGGMFCLLTDAVAARFTVNLDAVARSGLRVNPWVLRIARAPAVSKK